MRLYRTIHGVLVELDGRWTPLANDDWDALINDDDLYDTLMQAVRSGDVLDTPVDLVGSVLAPIGTQEVWAAGVTYFRSREARMEESKEAGGGDFYDKVYHADRPELFFKATPHRVVGDGGAMHLRGDSKWIVPEPELTLVVTREGKIVGYTIGNDLSCRDIEGQNPLYLPQAKTFTGCAGIGPCVYVTDQPLPGDTEVHIEIRRGGKSVFRGETQLSQMKKKLDALVEYLFRDNSFPQGALLMTGTGVVPPDDFSLQHGDEVAITIEPVGTLTNSMESA
ncbi:MAG: 2-hydroxyhepta-2,4-diene-1,7-dioate isomerase [Phycisphaera sp.]|nr:2-hydroxyhepta-2,4-diene-1,7-dioate isomerase [Phycisphaera sp.]